MTDPSVVDAGQFGPKGGDTCELYTIIRMPKLTLSVDHRVVERAKLYARERGTSVSHLVETMLDAVSSAGSGSGTAPPVLSRLRGSMKRGSVADYRRYLERKYR